MSTSPAFEAIVEIDSLIALLFPNELEHHRRLIGQMTRDRLHEQGIESYDLLTDTEFLGTHLVEHGNAKYLVHRHLIRTRYETK